MMEYLRIEDILSDSNGLFTAMTSIEGFDLWDASTAALMDNHYVNDWSGMKIIPHAIEKRLDAQNKLTGSNLELMANIIYMRYKKSWSQYYAYVAAQYNPIDNYSMNETEDTKVNTNMTTKQASDVSTYDKRNSFNAAEAVDVGSTRTQGVGDNNTVTNSGSWDDNKSNRVLKRSGNIGVTTTAQMLEGDSNFWMNWNLLTSIFKDVDKIMTIGVY